MSASLRRALVDIALTERARVSCPEVEDAVEPPPAEPVDAIDFLYDMSAQERGSWVADAVCENLDWTRLDLRDEAQMGEEVKAVILRVMNRYLGKQA